MVLLSVAEVCLCGEFGTLEEVVPVADGHVVEGANSKQVRRRAGDAQ